MQKKRLIRGAPEVENAGRIKLTAHAYVLSTIFKLTLDGHEISMRRLRAKLADMQS